MWVFEPIFKRAIWGGSRIKTLKDVDIPEGNIGESWELSSIKGSESKVLEGPDRGLSLSGLIQKYGAALMGEKNLLKFGNKFPLLIKFIDAKKDLSVQVHPDDALALSRGAESGKTEMWLILEASKGAKIAHGFNKEISREDYKTTVCSPLVVDYLNYHDVKEGDAFFIPAGRVHSIGGGTLLVEIQQSSDLTYRIYDYDRKDTDGKPRKLHQDEALEALNFQDVNPSLIPYNPVKGRPVNLVNDSKFTVNFWVVTNEVVRDYSEWDTFVVIIALKGAAKIISGSNERRIKKGETVLLPASCRNLKIEPEGEFQALETFIK